MWRAQEGSIINSEHEPCAERVSRTEAAAAEVSRLLTGAPDGAWLDVAEGTWTVKDVVGHLAAWSDLLMDGVEALVQGKADAAQVVDIDAWNARQTAARREWTGAQVRAAGEMGLPRRLHPRR